MIRLGFRGSPMLRATLLPTTLLLAALATQAAMAPPAQTRLIRKGSPHYSGGRTAHMVRAGRPGQFGMHRPGGHRLRRVAP